MSHTSNIDDILTQSKPANAPDTPESLYQEPAPGLIDDVPRETSEPDVIEHQEKADVKKPERETDEYGNERTPPKTYSEDEVNERINAAVRDRLARAERNTPSQEQQQQAAKAGFEYDADNAQDWQQQLDTYIDHRLERRDTQKAQKQQQQREEQSQAEFEDKFRSGMSKFNDYQEVLRDKPVTDAMLIATRGMQDPAAFLYAAGKRAPKELERISKIADPYSQMVEMGKLEERMKVTKPTTKAPKSMGRVQEDSTIDFQDTKEPTIEDLIARSAAQKLAKMNSHRRK